MFKSKTTVTPAPEEGKVWLLRLGAIGLSLLGLYAVYNIVWTAVSAAAGLAVIGGIALGGVAVFQAVPMLAQKWENYLLAARKREARGNPIEQLQNFLLAKTRQVNAFKEAVGTIGSQIKGLEDMIDERKKKGKDVSKQQESVKAMRQAHGVLIKKYQNAQDALVELRETIEDKKFEFSFAKAGQAAMQSLNATSGQDLLDAMLADEAFSSVRDNFNKVFADLEIEADRLNKAKQLEFGGEVIDVSRVNIPQLEHVRKR